MAYIASNNIGVFPLSKNRTADSPINSRLFYESNVSNIIRQLIDTQGFVISENANYNGTAFTGNFEFNLYGYYVIIKNGTSLSLGNDVYAELTLTDNDPQEINGQDDGDPSYYNGINFVTTEPSSGIYLHILTKDGNTWKIPEDSKVKFSNEGLGISAIDGKVQQ